MATMWINERFEKGVREIREKEAEGISGEKVSSYVEDGKFC
jgi:hypothetical protein